MQKGSFAPIAYLSWEIRSNESWCE